MRRQRPRDTATTEVPKSLAAQANLRGPSRFERGSFSGCFDRCRLLDSGESLRAFKSTATLTAGRSANESLESLGASERLQKTLCQNLHCSTHNCGVTAGTMPRFNRLSFAAFFRAAL
jgi:hypothetical protein